MTFCEFNLIYRHVMWSAVEVSIYQHIRLEGCRMPQQTGLSNELI
ncbi:MAG: hypothetical protein Faunusvirus35_9 [Faunusvirus sp.]|uniref:Uncharacterized protein n=1 Tax=Faunusvirus sp. TaxID=2487766 RepID=A0A3G4ZXU2_9VIRU|nr:MAG: hypothetical protein Faunusvirus35_9 [Faunusvirus sp.]